MNPLPSHAPSGPVMAHTDALRTRMLVPTGLSRPDLLRSHLTVIDGIAEGRDVWFPTFNYNFLQGQDYSVTTDPCQVGSINEFARVNQAVWRTPNPVFNFAGKGTKPVTNVVSGLSVAFDELSPFGQCVKLNGVILWYGAPFSTATIIHHAESRAGGPLYRFEKNFVGNVTDIDDRTSVHLQYHVRPKDTHVEYDWERMIPDLMAHGVIEKAQGDAPIFWASARLIVEFWTEKLSRDPLSLLDEPSRKWIGPELERLGRRFERSDFEVTE